MPFVNTKKILDKDQEGFRRFRNCTHAVMCLVQNVYNGFNKGESKVALFVDMEKAYDSVWRKGLLYKLYKMGIVGRVWQWIFAFLQDRKASCTLQEFKSPVFETEVRIASRVSDCPLAVQSLCSGHLQGDW